MTTDLDFRGWWFRGCDLINGKVVRLHLHRIDDGDTETPERPGGVFWAHVTFAEVSHVRFTHCTHGATVAEVAVEPRDDAASTYLFSLGEGSITVTARGCSALRWAI